MKIGMTPHVVPSFGDVDHTGNGMNFVEVSPGQSAAAGAPNPMTASIAAVLHVRTLVRVHGVAGLLQFARIGAVVALEAVSTTRAAVVVLS
jgi:hypothetical protein